MNVICTNYSRYTDHRSGVEFAPKLDYSCGCYVGHADIHPDQARHFQNREGFHFPDADEWEAMSTPPGRRKAVEAASEASPSGDPLADAAAVAPSNDEVDALKKLPLPQLAGMATALGIPVKAVGQSKADLAEKIAAHRAANPESPSTEPTGTENAPPPPPPSL